MKDLKQASARGAAWNLLQNLVSRLLGLLVVGIQSRMLARDAFGVVAVALVITSFAELFMNQGYGEFVTQTPDLKEEHLDTAFWFNLATGGTLTAIIALCATPLAHYLDAPSATSVIRWLSLSLLIRSCSVVPQGLLVRQLRFRALSLRTVFASVFGGIAAVIAVVLGLGVYSLVIQVLLGDVAATLMLWIATDWRPGRRLSRASIRELSGFGTPIIAAALLGFVSRRLDTVIVAGALGVTALGVYSLAQRAYQIALQVLNKSSVEVVFSALSRLADSEERRRQAFYKVIELTAVLCFPTYVGMAILSEPITLTLFGGQWLDAAPVLTLFGLSGVPFSLSLIHMAAMKSAAKTRLLLLVNFALLVIFMPAMLLLVRHGTVPAAGATLISTILIVPVEVLMLRSVLSVRVVEYVKAILGASVATIVMAAATVPTALATQGLPPAIRLVPCVAVGIAVYVVALRLLAPASFRRCLELAKQVRRNASGV